jgi:hypothetical protein
MTLHRALALAMMLAGTFVTAAGLIGFLSTSDPLAVIFVAFFVAPGLPAVLLGALMLLGRPWALRTLQVYVLLLAGSTLLVAFGLRVSALAAPAFLVPFLGFCLGWWAASLRVGRGVGVAAQADPAA